MVKANYIETEDNIRRINHGIEFYHDYVGADDPVAFLMGFAWLHGKPKSVDVFIRPASFSLLQGREATSAAIIADVKEAVELLLRKPGIPPGGQSGRMTAHVSTWLNG